MPVFFFAVVTFLLSLPTVHAANSGIEAVCEEERGNVAALCYAAHRCHPGSLPMVADEDQEAAEEAREARFTACKEERQDICRKKMERAFSKCLSRH